METIFVSALGKISPRKLSFSGESIEAILVPPMTPYTIRQQSIVVNLSPRPVQLDPHSPPLRPWRSVFLRSIKLLATESVVVLRVLELNNLGRVILSDAWEALGNTLPSDVDFPRDTPLWRSRQVDLGLVEIDSRHFTGQVHMPQKLLPFSLKLNLWYAPAHTDCSIHTGHEFLEVHTQVHGLGRMQKFRARKTTSLYEDVPMAPGFTHESFAIVKGESWRYPWHRYYADTDCVWLAIELHKLK